MDRGLASVTNHTSHMAPGGKTLANNGSSAAHRTSPQQRTLSPRRAHANANASADTKDAIQSAVANTATYTTDGDDPRSRSQNFSRGHHADDKDTRISNSWGNKKGATNGGHTTVANDSFATNDTSRGRKRRRAAGQWESDAARKKANDGRANGDQYENFLNKKKLYTVPLILVLFLECLLIAGVFIALIAVSSVQMTSTTKDLVVDRVQSDLKFIHASVKNPLDSNAKTLKMLALRYRDETEQFGSPQCSETSNLGPQEPSSRTLLVSWKLTR